jgi:hypothetical protein
MERWLPPLSTADLAVLGLTLALIFSASRIRPLAQVIARLLRRR